MPVYSGIDRADTLHALLSSGRLGLMTNQTGITRSFRPSADLLNSRYRLAALFAVEHGIRGSIQAGENVAGDTDPGTGLPVYSVYGKSHRLTPAMLDTFDIFCFDMQDVGARFYTYLYALSLAMEECAKAGKPVVVFDRINPLGGDLVQGTVLDPRFASYVGLYPLPTRYGLTVGEYARWVKHHLGLAALDLHVVPLEGWRRGMLPEETGLPWPPPSPNCPTFHCARAYAGTCVFEGTNVSEGRGTPMPFEFIGAPWIDADRLAARLAGNPLPGVHFRPAWFTPAFSKHAGVPCAGVQLHILDPRRADPVLAGLALLDAVRDLYPDSLQWISQEDGSFTVDKLLGTDAYRLGRYGAASLLAAHGEARLRFRKEREPFLLYE